MKSRGKQAALHRLQARQCGRGGLSSDNPKEASQKNKAFKPRKTLAKSLHTTRLLFEPGQVM